jgi:hypothetical protein
MAHIVTSVSELAAQLEKWPAGLFGIDGYQGAGKSTLAQEIAARLRVPALHLDDFLVVGEGGFVNFIRYDELAIALRARPLVVEGVCLLAVTNRLGITPDVLVYVQCHKPAPDAPRGTGPLAAEVAAYHRDLRPADTADILYVNTTIYQEVGAMDSARTDVDIAFIQAKTKLALFLASGGMLTLMVGLAVLLYGVTGQDQTLIKAGTMEVSASGLGGVIMITSAVWAFFSYKARPTYARVRQMSEEYDSEARLVRRHEHESSTQAAVGPAREG